MSVALFSAPSARAVGSRPRPAKAVALPVPEGSGRIVAGQRRSRAATQPIAHPASSPMRITCARPVRRVAIRAERARWHARPALRDSTSRFRARPPARRVRAVRFRPPRDSQAAHSVRRATLSSTKARQHASPVLLASMRRPRAQRTAHIAQLAATNPKNKPPTAITCARQGGLASRQRMNALRAARVRRNPPRAHTRASHVSRATSP